MAKPDFPALLPPGLHTLTLQQLHNLAVAPFAQDAQRQALYDKLVLWSTEFQTIGLTGVVWLDGSFLTAKPGPDDIDFVMWSPRWTDAAHSTLPNQQKAEYLFNRANAKMLYGLDVYLESPANDEVFHKEAYWRGVLGYCHDRVTAKGFAEVHL